VRRHTQRTSRCRQGISTVKLVVSGAGAAALACLGLLTRLGCRKKTYVVTDIEGVVYRGRQELMDPDKEQFAIDTKARTLGRGYRGCRRVSLALSRAACSSRNGASMADRPLHTRACKSGAGDPARVGETGETRCGHGDRPLRLSEPGQQRAVFPLRIRGALDVGATIINTEMELAAVKAIAALAQAEQSDIVAMAYGEQTA
jgi:malate dehydrogenase (oxaloacetate-decarboxylating)(NADP+)